MALADVVRFTAVSSGTGDFVVSAAVTGYQTPASANAVDGKTYRYRAESADLSQWEVGYGVYTVSSTTIARTTVLFNSSGTTSKINFTVAPQVGFVALAEDFRELLTAARTYYVRTDGSDSNTGLANTAGGAFLTLQKAYDTICSTLDLGGQTITVQVQTGTYSGQISIAQPWTGGGAVTYQGDLVTPDNVVLSNSGGDLILITTAIPGLLTFQGFKLTTVTASGNCILHKGSGVVQLQTVDFAASTSAHIFTNTPGAFVSIIGGYTISGGAAVHWQCTSCSGLSVQSALTITLTGTPAFSSEFALSRRAASLQCNLATFSGSATGTRYLADNNGVIFTNGGGANFLPGNAAGSTATGGQYN
jgi:hypothetical protein